MELRHQRGKYHAYRVTSKYDPKLKHSRKVTLEYLGAITKDGFGKPKHKQPPRLGGRLDAGLTAPEAYERYQERREFEYAYDALQNEVRGDVTWMRGKKGLVGYHFILFLGHHLYAQFLDHLKRKKMLSTWSVPDVLTYLSKVDIIQVNGKTHVVPVTAQTQTVIDRLQVPITENVLL